MVKIARRGWKLFTGIFALMTIGLLDRFVGAVLAWRMDLVMEPIASPYNEDAAESEPTDPIYESPAVERGAPPASMHTAHRFFSVGPQPLGGILPAARLFAR